MPDSGSVAFVPRSSGVLLHPTSLPSPYGIGDLGPAAYAWVDQLVGAGQSWWQTLPLGPTAYGDSPYQSPSSFAGNPYLVSPHVLLEEGLLKQGELPAMSFPDHEVHFETVIPFKIGMLEKAWDNFRGGAAGHLRQAFDQFNQENADWLDDFTLFMALKEHLQKPMPNWPAGLLRRETTALATARTEFAAAIDQHRFRQFLFFRQWRSLKAYANQRGLQLIGDVPIFVAGDSADLWSNAQLFLLDTQEKPIVVAGVPPDYFSPTGQLWGNPLYNWEAMRRDDYAWWVRRLKATLSLVDVVRLDHFRGFEAAWHVPANSPTAQSGHWVPGPRADFFEKIGRTLGKLPVIAEDLGEITPEVRALREKFHLPGMRILQFAFEGKPENAFLPHNYVPNTVVYTGTHDNDTTPGWLEGLPDHERRFLTRYLGRSVDNRAETTWELIRMAWSSVACLALAPLQDLLVLDRSARMNSPGRPSGNWRWRFGPEAPVHAALDRLRDLTDCYRRRR